MDTKWKDVPHKWWWCLWYSIAFWNSAQSFIFRLSLASLCIMFSIELTDESISLEEIKKMKHVLKIKLKKKEEKKWDRIQ